MPHTLPGCGSDWWSRKTNRYVDCTCPPSRYSPITERPTDPNCQLHGGINVPNISTTEA
jgi:hypothetical protein